LSDMGGKAHQVYTGGENAVKRVIDPRRWSW
jgi:hypothetical protein